MSPWGPCAFRLGVGDVDRAADANALEVFRASVVAFVIVVFFLLLGRGDPKGDGCGGALHDSERADGLPGVVRRALDVEEEPGVVGLVIT